MVESEGTNLPEVAELLLYLDTLRRTLLEKRRRVCAKERGLYPTTLSRLTDDLAALDDDAFGREIIVRLHRALGSHAPRMHPRVANVRHGDAHWDIYVGRGKCPCGDRACGHILWVKTDRTHNCPTPLGNPYSFEDYGPHAMRMFLDDVAGPLNHLQAFAREKLRGLVLGCWCRGKLTACHAEVWCRLADGEELSAIRADLLARIGLEDGP